MAVSADGINLEDQPLVLDFHGGSDGDPEPYACWVTLFFMVAVPGGRLKADAEYENRGEFEVVDRQRLNFQTTALPEIGLRPAEIADVERTLAKTDRAEQIEEAQGERCVGASEWYFAPRCNRDTRLEFLEGRR